jgi:hypothetical protein
MLLRFLIQKKSHTTCYSRESPQIIWHRAKLLTGLTSKPHPLLY